jgi:hypothetical protein
VGRLTVYVLLPSVRLTCLEKWITQVKDLSTCRTSFLNAAKCRGMEVRASTFQDEGPRFDSIAELFCICVYGITVLRVIFYVDSVSSGSSSSSSDRGGNFIRI